MLLPALLLSIKVACAGMVVMLPWGLAVAWWVSRPKRTFSRTFISAAILLPLVLPPTVVGFVLLTLLGRGSGFGTFLNDVVHINLVFTWEAAALAAAVMAFPLFTRTAASAFASVDQSLLESARSQGASEVRVLMSVVIPAANRGVLAATALGFARSIGEFGATFMVAGSIPGRTQTLSLALYDAVQAGDTSQAWLITALLSCFAVLILVAVGIYESRLSRI